MSKLKLITGINLLILVFYTVIINVASTGNERGLGVMIMMAFIIAVQVFTNIVISVVNFTSDKHALGRSYLLSAGIVLLIGFSACLGTASL